MKNKQNTQAKHIYKDGIRFGKSFNISLVLTCFAETSGKIKRLDAFVEMNQLLNFLNPQL